MTRLARVLAFGLAVGLAATAGAPGAARAEDPDDAAKSSYRVIVDRADLEPASIGGVRLHVYVSALSLAGGVADLDPDAFRVTAGSTKLTAPVYGRFAASDAQLAVVVLVETAAAYEALLPAIGEGIDTQLVEGLAPLGDRMQIAVVGYGEAVVGGKLGPGKAAHGQVTGLAPDGSAGEPVLLDAVDHALKLLKKAKSDPEGQPLRKVVVVIGDGRDLSADRDRVTRVAERAAKEGVRIDTLGFAPDDIRRPLLTLGELAKRSAGTFRWVRRADSWAAQLGQVRDEIMRQYELTYFLADDAVAGKPLVVELQGRVVATSLKALKIPPSRCNGAVCDTGYCAADRCVVRRPAERRGLVGWVVRLVGIGVGALLLLGVIGWLMSRRQPPRPFPLPGQLPGMGVLPGTLPPGAPPRPSKPARPAKLARSKPPKSIPPPVVIAPAVVAPTTGPRFYVMSGPQAGRELAVHNGFTIGKAPGSNLEIDDGYTSSQHAQIGVDHFGNCRIYDRMSTNGTFVNGARVNEYALDHGMTVKIGSTELRFLAQ